MCVMLCKVTQRELKIVITISNSLFVRCYSKRGIKLIQEQHVNQYIGKVNNASKLVERKHILRLWLTEKRKVSRQLSDKWGLRGLRDKGKKLSREGEKKHDKKEIRIWFKIACKERLEQTRSWHSYHGHTSRKCHTDTNYTPYQNSGLGLLFCLSKKKGSLNVHENFGYILVQLENIFTYFTRILILFFFCILLTAHLVTNSWKSPTRRTFSCIYLFLVSTCFERHSAHLQEIEFY